MPRSRVSPHLGAGAWQPIETVPNTGELVLFYTPGQAPLNFNRADDWHNNASWLQRATHWHPLPALPIDTTGAARITPRYSCST